MQLRNLWSRPRLKSLAGLTTYKMEIVRIEGLLTSIALLILPFLVLAAGLKILPPWDAPEKVALESTATG